MKMTPEQIATRDARQQAACLASIRAKQGIEAKDLLPSQRRHLRTLEKLGYIEFTPNVGWRIKVQDGGLGHGSTPVSPVVKNIFASWTGGK
jgi:hypothetical protein